MTYRRLLIFAGILLILFLAMYSWNRRTRILDDIATNVGLELSSTVLAPMRAVEDVASNFWKRYFDLVDVREENLRLKSRLEELEAKILATGEDLAELKRLRELVQFPVDVRWRPLAARVLAGRLGPNAVLDSITISRGYMNGARPGTPLVTHLGLVGRVLRSSPHASTALLITDPGSRVSVFGQESRAQGILKGHGLDNELEVDFVQRDASMKNGEILVTSGLDDKYPKGLPVARVTSVTPSDYTQFMAVAAHPLVDLRHIEEVLLLEKSGIEPEPEETEKHIAELVGPPLPPHLAKKTQKTIQETLSAPQGAQAQPNPAVAPASGTPTQASAQGTSRIPAPLPPEKPKPANTVSGNPPQQMPSETQPSERKNSSARIASPPDAVDTTGAIPRNREGAPKYRIITP